LIAYFDTSVVLKLFLDDERGVHQADEIWSKADVVATAEIAYAEARAALAAAPRAGRLTKIGLEQAREEFETLWPQLEVVEITRELVRRAGDLAELEALRGFDAVHLAAALRIDADVMASADRALCDAAARHGRAIANPR
jgi:uncharacterized protein